MKIDVKTIDNKAAGDITLADAVFGVAPRADIVARVVKWQLAKRRAGTHKVKSRAEVAITTAKMFKQNFNEFIGMVQSYVENKWGKK